VYFIYRWCQHCLDLKKKRRRKKEGKKEKQGGIKKKKKKRGTCAGIIHVLTSSSSFRNAARIKFCYLIMKQDRSMGL